MLAAKYPARLTTVPSAGRDTLLPPGARAVLAVGRNVLDPFTCVRPLL